MIDLIICLESTSSMTSYLNKVRMMLISILIAVPAPYQNAIRMSVIQFRSRARRDCWLTKAYTSTQNIRILQQWLDNVEAFGGSDDQGEPIGDALQEALNIFQLPNVNGNFDKKLVILITHGAPNGLFTLLDDRFAQLNGTDPWLVANKFNKQGITLAVVGVEPCIIECDDFYCALARKTGGLYIPLINAADILSSVIQSVILGGCTFREAFFRVKMGDIEQNSSFKYSCMKDQVNDMISECETMANIEQNSSFKCSHMKDRINGMISECETMTDIQQLFFNHHRS